MGWLSDCVITLVGGWDVLASPRKDGGDLTFKLLWGEMRSCDLRLHVPITLG